jgi:hypothetical protein
MTSRSRPRDGSGKVGRPVTGAECVHLVVVGQRGALAQALRAAVAGAPSRRCPRRSQRRSPSRRASASRPRRRRRGGSLRRPVPQRRRQVGISHKSQRPGRRAEHVAQAERADGVHRHVRRAHLSSDPVGDLRRHRRIRGVGPLTVRAVQEAHAALARSVDRQHGKTARGQGCRRPSAPPAPATIATLALTASPSPSNPRRGRRRPRHPR